MDAPCVLAWLAFRAPEAWQEHLKEHEVAKKSLVAKQQRESKYKVRSYTRCNRCGRPRAVYRKFGLCRICLRELAHQGAVPGMTKSSW